MDKIIMPRKDGPDFTRDVEDSNKVSDGYHTFGELYDHRISLFIALCLQIDSQPFDRSQYCVWRSILHSDLSKMDGWFILGIGKNEGEQITYHVPIERWDECGFAREFAKAPEFDGHTPEDVLERLKNL